MARNREKFHRGKQVDVELDASRKVALIRFLYKLNAITKEPEYQVGTIYFAGHGSEIQIWYYHGNKVWIRVG